MSKRNNFLIVGTCVFIAMFTVNCSKSDSKKKNSVTVGGATIEGSKDNTDSNLGSAEATAISETASENTGSKDTPEADAVDAKIKCENEIAVIDDLEEFNYTTGTDTWDLVSIELHVQDEYGSYLVNSNKENTFQPEVVCNGLDTLEGKNYSKTTETADGRILTESSSSTYTTSASTSASNVIKLNPNVQSSFKRKLSVSFKDGKLIDKSSELIPSSSNKTEGSLTDGYIRIDRMEVSENTFISIRSYATSENTMEIRVQTEYKEKNGIPEIHHSRFKYQKLN